VKERENGTLLMLLLRVDDVKSVEFVREEIVAILGMMFVAFFSQISMEVQSFFVSNCLCMYGVWGAS